MFQKQKQDHLLPIFVIPARLASQRLPRKALADIAGKPMIQHVWEQACSFQIGPVIVACSDQEIADIITSQGGTAILTDPDLPSGTDRIAQALKKYENSEKYNFIINLQGDLPLIEKSAIEALLHVAHTTNADITTLASPITKLDELQNPNIVKISATQIEASEIYKAHYFSRHPIPFSDGTVNPKLHFHHIGLYGYQRDALHTFVELSPSPLEVSERLEQLRAIENGLTINMHLYHQQILGIDTEEDLQKAREIMHYGST